MGFLVHRNTTYEVCPNCDCRVETRHHRSEDCLIHRKAVNLRLTGATLDKIGRELEVSRQRVQQIMSKYVGKAVQSAGPILTSTEEGFQMGLISNCPKCGAPVKLNSFPVVGGKTSQGGPDDHAPDTPIMCPACKHEFLPTDIHGFR